MTRARFTISVRQTAGYREVAQSAALFERITRRRQVNGDARWQRALRIIRASAHRDGGAALPRDCGRRVRRHSGRGCPVARELALSCGDPCGRATPAPCGSPNRIPAGVWRMSAQTRASITRSTSTIRSYSRGAGLFGNNPNGLCRSWVAAVMACSSPRVERLVPCQGLIFGLAEMPIRTKPCGIRASERTALSENLRLTDH